MEEQLNEQANNEEESVETDEKEPQEEAAEVEVVSKADIDQPTSFKDLFNVITNFNPGEIIAFAASTLFLIFFLFVFFGRGELFPNVNWVSLGSLNLITIGTLIFFVFYIFMVAEKFFAFETKNIKTVNTTLVCVGSLFLVIGFIREWAGYEYISGKIVGDYPGYFSFGTLVLFLFVIISNAYWAWDVIVPFLKNTINQLKEKKTAESIAKAEQELQDASTETVDVAPGDVLDAEDAKEAEEAEEVEEAQEDEKIEKDSISDEKADSEEEKTEEPEDAKEEEVEKETKAEEKDESETKEDE